MKKHFITGLIIFLPLAVTLLIVFYLINFFTKPFVGFMEGIFRHFGLFQKGFFFLDAPQLQLVIAEFLILLSLFFLTVLFGFFARWFFVHYFVSFNDFIFHRIPIVRTIYKTSKELVYAIFGEESVAFKEVVLAPFPNSSSYCLGFVIGEEIKVRGEEKRLSVFISTTPSPSNGYLVLYKKEELVYTDIPIDQALKFIVSCGVILPEKFKPPLEALKKPLELG